MTNSRQNRGFLSPEWPLPAGVGCLISNRYGGVSLPPYQSFNLGDHVGDQAEAVASNRQRLQAELEGCSIQWLKQVHGVKVVEALPGQAVRTADACFSRTRGVACAILTADCLPILLCDTSATVVAAVHAGWRGLVAGVIGEAVSAMAVASHQLTAYIGPGISQRHYEVGIDVVEALYGAAATQQEIQAISDALLPGHRPLHFFVDLAAVARAQLHGLGVQAVYGGHYCTFSDPQFYSHRQQAPTGRQASLIWLRP